MSFGKANAKLRKMILFDLVKECNKDICYRCKKRIDKIEDLSIEHKIAWLDSANPRELFFDLNNIAFSHLDCNSKNRRIDKINLSKKVSEYHKNKNLDGLSWCGYCKKRLPKENFSIDKSRITRCKWICKECRKIFRRENRSSSTIGSAVA